MLGCQVISCVFIHLRQLLNTSAHLAPSTIATVNQRRHVCVHVQHLWPALQSYNTPRHNQNARCNNTYSYGHVKSQATFSYRATTDAKSREAQFCFFIYLLHLFLSPFDVLFFHFMIPWFSVVHFTFSPLVIVNFVFGKINLLFSVRIPRELSPSCWLTRVILLLKLHTFSRNFLFHFHCTVPRFLAVSYPNKLKSSQVM